jgi:2-isopropylmalate synthase
MAAEANPAEEELIYDWNLARGQPSWPVSPQFYDRTLLSGSHAPWARCPSVEERRELLARMDELSLEAACLGHPGASAEEGAEVRALAARLEGLRLAPGCRARLRPGEVEAVAEVAQAAGRPVEVALTLPSSGLHPLLSPGGPGELLAGLARCARRAGEMGLPVMVVVRDAPRAHPEVLARVIRVAAEAGATRLCLSDSAGHAIPAGVARLVGFTREALRRLGSSLQLDWHGTNDRGLALANALAALRAGVQRVHAAALGLGERCGGVPMDLLLVNLKLLGATDRPMHTLRAYCEKAAQIYGFAVPASYPVLGADAFRTGTGVHAAAIIKAHAKGDAWLADRIYSGVPAGLFGCRQIIEVGPMAGESNAVWWLRQHGLEPTRPRIEAIMARAKQASRVLADEEIREALGDL